tara:strand:- start:41181 stop:41786 length:606 start_codon:yes stop_codon:yes gene_type:complete
MITNPLKLKLTDENIALISAESERTGIPYAKIINNRITRSYKQLSCEQMLDTLEVSDVLRMTSMNTTKTAHEIVRLLRRPTLARVIMAAKPDKLNGRALVVIFEMEDITIVADNTMNNLARSPRIMEIEEIFHEFSRLRLQNKALFIPEPVEDTSSLPVEEAFNRLSSYRMKSFDLEGYLSVLSENSHLFDLKSFQPKEQG